MIQRILILFLLISFSSCNYQLDTDEKPADLIEKEAFTNILHDIMVVESFYKSEYGTDRKYLEKLPPVIDTIFQNHGVDSVSFNHSMDYYSGQQKELLEIYHKIQDELTLSAVKYENHATTSEEKEEE